jgi:arylsulfatase
MTGFEDWLPTLLTLAGLKSKIPNGLDGIDFSNILLGQSQLPRPFLYREFPGYGGQQAVWSGKWKAVRQNLNRQKSLEPNAEKRIHESTSSMKTQLYDLEKDPSETENIADLNPEIISKLEKVMKSEHENNLNFPFPILDNH